MVCNESAEVRRMLLSEPNSTVHSSSEVCPAFECTAPIARITRLCTSMQGSQMNLHNCSMLSQSPMPGSCYITGVEHDLASNSNDTSKLTHTPSCYLTILEFVAQAKLEAAHLPVLAWAVRTPSFQRARLPSTASAGTHFEPLKHPETAGCQRRVMGGNSFGILLCTCPNIQCRLRAPVPAKLPRSPDRPCSCWISLFGLGTAAALGIWGSCGGLSCRQELQPEACRA